MSGDKGSDDETTAYIGLFGSIEEGVVREVVDLIANKLPDTVETLYFLFSTSGGDVSYGFVLYNFLRALPLKIVMHNVGSVDSIGNVIFLAASERYTVPTGTFLIHRVKGTAKNDNAELSYLHEKLSTVLAEEVKIRSVFLERSQLPEAEFARRFEKGELQSAGYAKQYGLAHDIRELSLPPKTRIHMVGLDKGGQ
jgi:ATP-dependent protease ClpP protease subunit